MIHIRRSSLFVAVVVGLTLSACGGGTAATTSSTELDTTTTLGASTTAPETTTTTAPSTTTTTMPAVESAAIQEAFRSYFDLVIAQDFEGARQRSSGPAASYASFTEELNSISSQPEWQLETESDVGCCDVVLLDDGRFATATALTYTEPNGGVLAVSNPSIEVEGDTSLLYEWGVDVGNGTDQPRLSQRIKSIARGPEPDPSSCFSDGRWAYVPGGSDTSTEVRIIAIGLVCDTNHDLVPKIAESRLFAQDGSVDVTASTFLIEGGGDVVPVNTPLFYLAIFDIPRQAASVNLIWDTPFDRVGLPATTFLNFEIGPFSLD